MWKCSPVLLQQPATQSQARKILCPKRSTKEKRRYGNWNRNFIATSCKYHKELDKVIGDREFSENISNIDVMIYIMKVLAKKIMMKRLVCVDPFSLSHMHTSLRRSSSLLYPQTRDIIKLLEQPKGKGNLEWHKSEHKIKFGNPNRNKQPDWQSYPYVLQWLNSS